VRVLALDPGGTLGYAALGDGKVAAGSRKLNGDSHHMGIAGRHCSSVVRELICDHGPFDVVAFAKPYVGSVMRFDPKKGRKVPQPVEPDSLRPLMGFMTVIEMVCDELRIRCVEIAEMEARREFVPKLPRKSKDIKRVVMQECRDRKWPCSDDHASDALCVGSFVLSKLEPSKAHEAQPLFIHAKDRPKVVRGRARASRVAVG